MNVRVIVILVIFSVLAMFVALNLSAFLSPTTLSLGFWTVQAPLGLIMLATVALLSAMFLAFVVYLQGSVIMETRRQSRELQGQRELADKAEASRFTELRTFLAAELQSLATRVDGMQSANTERLERMDRDFGAALERTESAIAAYVGELDDRMSGGAPESKLPAPGA